MLQKLRRFCGYFFTTANFSWLLVALSVGGTAGLLWGAFFGWIFFPFATACKFGSLTGSSVASVVWLAYVVYYTWTEIRPKPHSLRVTYQPPYPNPTTDDMTNVVLFPKHDRKIRRAAPPSSAA